jgi:hypothetical protein
MMKKQAPPPIAKIRLIRAIEKHDSDRRDSDRDETGTRKGEI